MPELTRIQAFRLFFLLAVAGILIKAIDWPWMQEVFGPAPMWIVIGLLIAIAIGATAAFILSAIASRMR